MTNNRLIEELNNGAIFADEQGYWKSRNHNEFPGWAWRDSDNKLKCLPFADFFEDLSSAKGHKKMWLNTNGQMLEGRLSDKRDTLIPLYEGIQQTMRSIVSTGYFMYSAGIVSLHLNLAYWSRKLQCAPTVKAVVEAAPNEEVRKDILNRASGLRVIAFICYEGDGLGSYNHKVWKFWGRLLGKTAPTHPSFISEDEVQKCSREFRDADMPTKRRLFTEWWNDVHPGYEDGVVSFMCTTYLLAKRYGAMESPRCSKDNMFDSKSSFDIQAALCGFFRRSAVGLGEARTYDANEQKNPAHRLSDMLLSVDRDKLERMLTGHEGITPFGEYMLNMLDIHELRNELVDRIVSRDDDASEVKEGFSSRVSKRGLRRRM